MRQHKERVLVYLVRVLRTVAGLRCERKLGDAVVKFLVRLTRLHSVLMVLRCCHFFGNACAHVVALAVGTLRARVARLRRARILRLQGLRLLSILRCLALLELTCTILRLSRALVRESVSMAPALGRGRFRNSTWVSHVAAYLVQLLAFLSALLLGTVRLNAGLRLLTTVILRRSR